MNYPGFTAELSLGGSKRTYYGKCLYGNLSQNVMPNQLESVEDLYEEDESDLIAEQEMEQETEQEMEQDIEQEMEQDIEQEMEQE